MNVAAINLVTCQIERSSAPWNRRARRGSRWPHWRKIEAAKRRLIYSLLNLDLPIPTAASGDVEPLVFEFLGDPPNPSWGPKVMTGHDNGAIKLLLAEADDGMREQLRVSMGEPIVRCLAISATKSAIIIGTGWCVTGVTSRTVEPSSATRVMTMRPRLLCRRRTRRVATKLRQRLCDNTPLGGFR